MSISQMDHHGLMAIPADCLHSTLKQYLLQYALFLLLFHVLHICMPV